MKDESTFYLKSELDDSGKLRTYNFIEKILGGEINLYKMFFAGSPGGPNSAGSPPMTYLYLEKGSDFRPLGLLEFHLLGNKEDKDKRIEILKSFVSDKPDLLTMINAEDFKPNEENIFNVVRDYNLSKYKPYENSDNPSSSVFFYVKGKVTKPLKLIANESAEYNLLTVGFTSIKLPINQYTKVCVNSYCQTLESSPWYIRYFEVEINEKKNRIRIHQIKSLDANLNIKRKLEWEKEK